MTRLIDADSLRVRYQAILDRGGMFCEYDIIGMLDTEPTVEINDKSLEIARKSIELGRRVGKLEGKLERPQGEWIPVSERLPDVSQRYLVYTKYDEVMTDFFMGDEFMQGDDIIAWQPLPEPYKKGGDQ